MLTTSRKIILLLAVSFIVSGFLEGAYPKLEEVLFVPHSIFIGICLFVWCGHHAAENNLYPPNGAKLFCGLLAAFGVPIYFFRAFGFKEGGIKFLIALIVFASIVGLYLLSYMAGEILVK